MKCLRLALLLSAVFRTAHLILPPAPACYVKMKYLRLAPLLSAVFHIVYLLGPAEGVCSTGAISMHRSQQSGDEGDSITVNFDLNCALTDNFYTVGLTYTDVKATATVDFTGPASVTVPAGVTFFSTMVTLSGDIIVEVDETFEIVLDSIGTTGAAADTVSLSSDPTKLTTTVTIEDDDTVIHYNGGTATDPSDFSAGDETVTLALAPANTANVEIVIAGDTVVEDHETFTVTLGAASEPAAFGRTDAIFTDTVSFSSEIAILDNDVLKIDFPQSVTASEGANNVPFEVNYASTTEDEGFSFTYTILGTGTAESGDYSASGVFATSPVSVATSATSQTYSYTFIDNDKTEDDETFTVVLEGVSHPTLYQRSDAIVMGSTVTTTVVIEDDDDAVVTVLASGSQIENQGDMTTTVFLSKQLEDSGYMAYIESVDGTAVSGMDFVSVMASVPIPACVSSFTYVVDVTNDDTAEDWETFSLSLTGATPPPGFRSDAISVDTTMDTSTFTILDDETVTIGLVDLVTFTESNGYVTVTVSVGLPAGNFQEEEYSATLTIIDGSTDGASDFSTMSVEFLLENGMSNLNVPVQLSDDSKFEDFEDYTVSLLSVSPPPAYSRTDGVRIDTAADEKTGVIEDDDLVTLNVDPAGQTVTEGMTATVEVTLTGCFEDEGFSLTVTYAGGDLSDSGTYIDYQTVDSIDLPTGNLASPSLEITTNIDKYVEDTESISIALSEVGYPASYTRTSGVTFVPGSISHPLTVTDDDFATVEMSTNTFTVIETDSGTVTATLSFDWDNTILISGCIIALTWSDDTAMNGNDYHIGEGSLEIPTETLVQTFVFTVPADVVVEDFESFQVTLASITDPIGLVRTDMPVKISATDDSTDVTIIDDDTASICLDLSATTATEGGSNFYTVSTDLEIEDQFSVSLTFMDGSATFPSDFTDSDTTEPLPISSNANSFSESYAWAVEDDLKVEDDEIVSIKIDSIVPPGGFVRTTPAVLVGTCSIVETVIYDDDTATVEMDLRDTQRTEGSNVIINVDISGGELCTEGFSITLTYSDSTAEDGSDYSGVSSAEIPTYAGTESQFFFQIPLSDDSIVEDHEIFAVVLTDAAASTVTRTDMVVVTDVSEDQSTSVTIMDDDSATLTVVSSDLCPTEGDITAEITLALDNQVQDAGFSYTSSYEDIDALSSNDYSNANTQGDIPTLTNTFTFTVTLSEDMVVEAEQSFSVTFSSVSLPASYIRTDGIYLHTTDTTSTVTIKDDDTATLSLTSKVTVSEGDPSAEITVFMSNPVEDPTDFSAGFTYTSGDAGDSGDYSAGPASLGIPVNPATELTVTVDLTDDSIVEDLESFSVQLTSVTDPLTSNSMTIGVPDTATVCIIDDDTATIALDFAGSIAETDTTVTLTIDITGDTIVDTGFTATLGYGGSSADGSDFTSVDEVLIPPSVSSTEVEVVINADDVVEDNELIIVDVSGIGHSPFTIRTTGAVIVHPTPAMATQSYTILDDDTATLTFQLASHSVGESDVSVELILDLTKTVQDTGFSFDVTFFEISAEEDADYSTAVTSFSIDPLSLSTTMTIGIQGDLILEDDELFGLTLVGTANPGSFIRTQPGVELGTSSISTTVTIRDDDFATCSFNPSEYCVDENTATIDVTFECNIICEDSGFTFDLSYTDGTAEDNNDYMGVVNSLDYTTGLMTFSFSASILNNLAVEDDEDFTIHVNDIVLPTGYTRTNIITIDNTATVTIKDEDIATCTINNNPVATEGVGVVVDVEVVCSKEVDQSGFSIDISLFDDTAFDTMDFNGAAVTTVDILPSQTTFTFNVPLLNDEVVEGTEQCLGTLGTVNRPASFMRTDAVITEDVTGTITIDDDDTTTCSLSATTACTDEGTDIGILVECTNEVQDDGFQVLFDYVDGTATSFDDYTGTMDLVDIPTATTLFGFNVEILQDSLVEDIHSFTITLTGALSPYIPGDAITIVTSTTTVSIKDDDTVTCSLVSDFVTVTEGVGVSADIEVTCDLEVEEAGFMLDISYADKGTSGSSDYTATQTLVPVPTFQTSFSFAVEMVNDDVVEDFESFCVNLNNVEQPPTFSRPGVAEADLSTATVTVNDDDTAVCQVDQSPVCATEGVDWDATVTITCDKVIADSGVEIDVTYRDVSAFNPGDYFGTVTIATIPTGSSAFPLAVPLNDDTLIETDEIFEVILVAVSETGTFVRNDVVRLGSDISGSVTIKDTDSVTCSFANPAVMVGESEGLLTVDVECNAAVTDDGFSFDLSYVDGSATLPDDYTSVVNVLGLPTSVTTLSFSVSIESDDLVEDDHSFTINVENVVFPTGAGANDVNFQGSQIVIIIDDDTATCSFVSSDICLGEDQGTFTSEVTCDAQIEDSGVTFDLAFTDGTALDGSDYTSINPSFDFFTSTTALSFSASILDDGTVEDHETFFISVSNVGYPTGFVNTDAVVWEGTQTVIVKCDDTATCTFHSPVTGPETAAVHTAIECDVEVDTSVTFGLVGVQITTEPNDWTVPFGGILTVGPGLVNADVYISLTDDNFVENDEVFALAVDEITFPNGFQHTDGVQFQGSLTGTIVDDDSVTCTVSIDDPCINENEGVVPVTVECDTLIEEVGFAIDIQVQDDSATQPSDYTLSNTIISIPSSSQTFEADIDIVTDDAVFESDETFVLIFNQGNEPVSFPRSNVIEVTECTHTVTIKDDDVMETTESVETTVEPEGSTKFDPTTEATTDDEPPTTEQPTTSADEQPAVRNLAPDVDPCLFGNACPGENMECSSSNGTAICLCASGYAFDDLDSDTCRDINECLTSPCHDVSHEDCINTRGSYQCVCRDGFERNSQGNPCQDVDECQQSPCHQNQHCLNLEGSFQCSCLEGFRESADGLCEDINECEEVTSSCSTYENTKCVNTYGNYTCPCIEGYLLSSSGICSPADECTPEQKDKCKFPEDLCMVNDVGEYVCSCSPGFTRTSPSLACENKNECQEVPNICSSIANSHCVDELPTETNPDQFYTCSCDDGFVELVTGKCVEEVIFRLSANVLTVNSETGSSLWSSDLNNKNSARFRQSSEFFCSFFQDAVLTTSEVNRTTCSGLGFAVENSGLKVALQLGVLSAHSSLSSEVIKSSILKTSFLNKKDVRIFGKSNEDTISVKEGSIDVQLLKDVACFDTLCKNGGTCILDKSLYETSCQCVEGFDGVYCETDASSVLVHDNVSGNIGLFIGLSFASLIIFLVMVGLCWMLLRSNQKAFKESGKTAYRTTPARLAARPFITKVPEVVRNPLSRSSADSSGLDDENNYDDIRMKHLERTFKRIGVLESARLTPNKDFEDDTTSSTGFSVPFAVDGSVNV